jgi:hypothetical protein
VTIITLSAFVTYTIGCFIEYSIAHERDTGRYPPGRDDMRLLVALLIACSLAVFAGCAGNPNSSVARQCENGLSVAYQELDFAKARGLDGTVEYSKAVGLLTAARVQSEFGKYPNCVEKVDRARAFIGRSQTAR